MSSNATSRRADVVIRGAGVVGQALALLLAQERLRVRSEEHTSELQSH